MSTYYIRSDKDLKGLLAWLKKRWWARDDKTVYQCYGFIVGVYKILKEVWESDFWLRRIASGWHYEYERPEISRTFVEVFTKNREVFVDQIKIEIPKETSRR